MNFKRFCKKCNNFKDFFKRILLLEFYNLDFNRFIIYEFIRFGRIL